MPICQTFTVTSTVSDALHEREMMDRHTIPIRPGLGESGIPLAGWTIRIAPKAPDTTDDEYDAGLAALAEHDTEHTVRTALTVLGLDHRMRGFTITME